MYVYTREKEIIFPFNYRTSRISKKIEYFDESSKHCRSQGGNREYVNNTMLIIRYLIVITLVPLILITRFAQFAHSVVLMTNP